MGWDGVDPNRVRLDAAFVEQSSIPVLLDRGPQLRGVEAETLADAHQVVDAFELAGPLPVRLEQRVMHLVELARLARELRGRQRSARVDDHAALPHREPDLRGD